MVVPQGKGQQWQQEDGLQAIVLADSFNQRYIFTHLLMMLTTLLLFI